MKKSICLVLSLIIFVCCCSVFANATYEESLTFDSNIKGSWIVDVTGNKLSSKAPSYLYQFDTEAYALGYSCYDYLDAAQKHVYDAIVSNVGKLSFTINFPNYLFKYENFTQKYLDVIMHALCTDRPDIFYYAGYSVTGGSLYSGGVYLNTMNYQASPYDSSYYTASNLPGYYSALMSAVKAVPVDLSNRYNFIKSVHDYLADTVYYPDLNTSDYVMSAHDAYGALVEGRAVCQGYSDAIKILCDYYNIPCVCISGTAGGGGHMWNAVQMDDGKWYFIDCTWDDQESQTYYDFFLVGSQSTNTFFGGKQFSAEHVNDENLSAPIPSLYYSTVAYNRSQNHNSGFNATYNSYANSSIKTLYLSVLDAGSSNVYYNGIYVEVPDFYNGDTFTAPSGTSGANEQWTLITLGDSNYDEVCDELDYSASVNIALSEGNSANSFDKMACDVNVDGYIDALDVAQIAQVSSGVKDNFILN